VEMRSRVSRVDTVEHREILTASARRSTRGVRASTLRRESTVSLGMRVSSGRANIIVTLRTYTLRVHVRDLLDLQGTLQTGGN
jgi:hypothetical protein